MNKIVSCITASHQEGMVILLGSYARDNSLEDKYTDYGNYFFTNILQEGIRPYHSKRHGLSKARNLTDEVRKSQNTES